MKGNRSHLQSVSGKGTFPRAYTYSEYQKVADSYRQQDKSSHFASGMNLTERENRLNLLMKDIRNEVMCGENPYLPPEHLNNRTPYAGLTTYYPLHAFSEAKNNINQDILFPLFQKMPKGGNLHLHSSVSLSIGRFITLLRKFDGDEEWAIYLCKGLEKNHKKLIDGTLLLLPSAYSVPVRYTEHLLSLNQYSDEDLETLFSLGGFDKRRRPMNIRKRVREIYARMEKIMTVRQFFTEYYAMTFEELWEDNIDYAEIHLAVDAMINNNIVELQATALSETALLPSPDAVAVMWDIYQKFAKQHEGFGLKLIISESNYRDTTYDDVGESMNQVYEWMQEECYADEQFVIGYNMVNRENRKCSMDSYVRAICESAHGKDIPLYFHDGNGASTDSDGMYAAAALGAKRIGHALNLFRFPSLVDGMKQNQIALEICPISERMMRYTPDLRLHPVGEYMGRGIECVICSDKPMIFDNEGLSYDYWEIFFAQMLDLREIKQFILNSYQFSGMMPEQYEAKVQQWEKKWALFVDEAYEMLQQEVPSLA